MTQFTQLREMCDKFGLSTELSHAPTEDGEKEFEMIVDFDSGPVNPEEAIAAVEEDFDISIYDASASRYDHSLEGEYVLALST